MFNINIILICLVCHHHVIIVKDRTFSIEIEDIENTDFEMTQKSLIEPKTIEQIRKYLCKYYK